MTVPWASLSASDQQRLLLCANRQVMLGAELLDQNLNVVSALMLLNASGSVKWTAASSGQSGQRDSVQTTATFTLALAEELNWGRDLVRLYKTVTDRDSGLSARGDLGVFMLPFPDRVAGAQIKMGDGSLAQAYSLSCQDRTVQLDRIPGADHTVAAGQTVLAGIKATLDAAGVTGYLLDGTNQAAMPTGGKTYPFAGGSQASWRVIVNDLCDLIGYEPIWCAGSGLLRITPNTDPSVRAISQAFDVATAGWVTPLAPSRTRKLDLSQTPNQWSMVWVDANGAAISNAASPFTSTNQSVGAASVDALGGAPLGLRPAQQQQLQASSATDFTARCQAIVNADIRGTTEYDVSTVMWPELPHSPVFAYTDPATTGSLSAVRTVGTSCEIALSDADSIWTLQEVA